MQKPAGITTTINSSTGAAVTATQTSSKVNAGTYNTVKAYLNITAVSGTTPTLVVKFQDSPDGTIWVDIPSGAFSSQTAAATLSLAIANVGPFVRAVQTITGTTPSFTYDLKVSGIL